jgi:Putative DNA-binding domain
MTLSNKRIEDIEEADLQGLVSGVVPEGRLVEYKITLPGGSDNDKKEFLADVSSFANASGGDIVYGMREEQGAAAELVGLHPTNLDTERLRLEEIIRNGVSPRIPGLTIKVVPLQSSGAALIIRVPRSFAQPHMVTFKGSSRFYSRNSGGKYQPDVAELRTAFLISETFAERARSFRRERLGQVVAGETPIKLQDPRFAVLHLIPASAFDPGSRFDISPLLGKSNRMRPMIAYGGFYAPRPNFDGLLSHASSDGRASSYVQLFRDGIIEAVLADVENDSHDGRKMLPSTWLEQQFIEVLPIYLRAQQDVGASPPTFLMFSLVGVSGYTLAVDQRYRYRFEQSPIDRDALLVPEIMLESFENEASGVLRPIFDAVWNAAGWPRSMNYDEEGVWRP